MSHRQPTAALSYMPSWVKAGYAFGCHLLTPSHTVNRGQRGSSTDRSMSSLGCQGSKWRRAAYSKRNGFIRPTRFQRVTASLAALLSKKWRKAESTIPSRLSPTQLFSKQRPHPGGFTFHTYLPTEYPACVTTLIHKSTNSVGDKLCLALFTAGLHSPKFDRSLVPPRDRGTMWSKWYDDPFDKSTFVPVR